MSALQKALAGLRNIKKYKYFMWLNGLKNSKIDYSKYTKEEFQEGHLKGVSFDFYEQWESTEEYQNLMLLLIKQKMRGDLFEIYKSVREKALDGDDKAVKTFLLLDKEVQQRLKYVEKNNSKEEEIDDGLTLE